MKRIEVDSAKHRLVQVAILMSLIVALVKLVLLEIRSLVEYKPTARKGGLYFSYSHRWHFAVFGPGLCLRLSILISVAFVYKLAILGPEVLIGSAIGALILFLLASIFLFAYSKYFMKAEHANISPDELEHIPTNKLLNDPSFEPASVTEHSTELLKRR